MRTLEILGALAAAAGLAAAAAAQSPSSYHEVEDDATVVAPFGITADELEDMDLFGPTGEQIGEVEEVLAGADGQPAAFAVETEELLGLGGKEVVLAFDRVELVDRLTTFLDEGEIETLPEWDD